MKTKNKNNPGFFKSSQQFLLAGIRIFSYLQFNWMTLTIEQKVMIHRYFGLCLVLIGLVGRAFIVRRAIMILPIYWMIVPMSVSGGRGLLVSTIALAFWTITRRYIVTPFSKSFVQYVANRRVLARELETSE